MTLAPAERFPDSSHGFGDTANTARRRSHIVEVFAVASRYPQVQLVKAGPTSECELLPQVGVSRKLDDQSAEEQILLNLRTGWPGGASTPRGNSCLGNHRSGSTVALRITFQRASRSPRGGARGSSGAAVDVVCAAR